MAIESQDDILSSGEISYTARLGLPRVPRNNTKALAALNALARIIDEKAVNRTGDSLTGNFVLVGNIQASGELTFTSAIFDNLVVASGEIESLVVAEMQANSGEFVDVVTTNLTATNVVSDTITARTITVDQIVGSSQSNILDLSTTRDSYITYAFTPRRIKYSVWASGEDGILVEGDVFDNTTRTFMVSSGDVDTPIGNGVPQKNGLPYFAVGLIGSSFSINISKAYYVPTPIFARIIAEK